MKKSLFIFILALFVTACGGRTEESHETVPLHGAAPAPPETAPSFPAPETAPPDERIPAPAPLVLESICIYRAAEYISKLEALLDAGEDTLWGANLNAPFAFADRFSRKAVANMPDNHGFLRRHEAGVYVGILPESVFIGTTATRVDDRLWGMVTWDFVEQFGHEPLKIVGVMAHEIFHAWQPQLFGGPHPGSPELAHMDDLDARITVMLEIDALFTALESYGDERIAAIQDALSIRAHRRRIHPGRAVAENLFEIHEGTATYIEARLGRQYMADKAVLIERLLNEHFRGQSLHHFGYITGALYGLLLTDLGADWKAGLGWRDDLGALLKEAAGITELRPFAELDLAQYEQIRAAETAWVENLNRLIQDAVALFAGPTLRFDTDGIFDADDSYFDTLVSPLDLIGQRHWVFYGDFVYTHTFGQIGFTGGFLLMGRARNNLEVSAQEIEIQENRVIGYNWILTLNDGYEICPFPRGGSFYIERAPD
ncbi:MAG: hypothetical protein FWB91_10020 [Defluviitaleaceae bacterium]|nr:hypothetical protein [Defluviitaleaceae bacterium]